MKVTILKERRQNETRVAATPETVKKMASLGLEMHVEKEPTNARGKRF